MRALGYGMIACGAIATAIGPWAMFWPAFGIVATGAWLVVRRP